MSISVFVPSDSASMFHMTISCRSYVPYDCIFAVRVIYDCILSPTGLNVVDMMFHMTRFCRSHVPYDNVLSQLCSI